MQRKKVILKGKNINSLSDFYDEIEKKLTSGLNWKIGRNLDAFNDILRGGFGVHGYMEPLTILWKDSEYSKEKLGTKETLKYLKNKIKRCHPSNVPFVKKEIEEAKGGKGSTLFDTIVEIIIHKENIELILG